jgi:uncharacterized oligopeptide transporter (OPT) family protein
MWAMSVAVYGVFFALPLRGPLIIKEKLPFPSGKATYETIVAMASAGDIALRRGRYLLRGAIGAGLFTVVSYFVPQMATPPLLQNIGMSTIAERYQWGLDIDLQLFGGGMMCGLKVGLSLLYGAITGFAILGNAVLFEFPIV